MRTRPDASWTWPAAIWLHLSALSFPGAPSVSWLTQELVPGERIDTLVADGVPPGAVAAALTLNGPVRAAVAAGRGYHRTGAARRPLPRVRGAPRPRRPVGPGRRVRRHPPIEGPALNPRTAATGLAATTATTTSSAATPSHEWQTEVLLVDERACAANAGPELAKRGGLHRSVKPAPLCPITAWETGTALDAPTPGRPRTPALLGPFARTYRPVSLSWLRRTPEPIGRRRRVLGGAYGP
ncbi:hypothetical protein FHS42_003410 [Streptomyces zagrosensis]|uniref:Uncharacterized protein n=1 Tax=Streptomyces zagrosensis TaxID=1042984 RepID=A0A7W9Q9X1_9ACTN|nr:hypothetical protein [Streptomyces zagrosensis]